MPKQLEKVKRYLNSMRLTYDVYSAQGEITRLVVPYQLTVQNLEYNVIIEESRNWIKFWAPLLSHEKIPDEKTREALYKELLVANGALVDVKYYITEGGDVGVIGHEGVVSLTVDGFRQELLALPFGIEHFLTNIASKLNLRISPPSKDTLSIYT
jgi:hypothetical protein